MKHGLFNPRDRSSRLCTGVMPADEIASRASSSESARLQSSGTSQEHAQTLSADTAVDVLQNLAATNLAHETLFHRAELQVRLQN